MQLWPIAWQKFANARKNKMWSQILSHFFTVNDTAKD
jgi:hypothetical protein